MKKIIKILFPLIFFIFISNILYAQDHIIQGVVHTFDSIPLIGAEIKVKSTKQIVLTDTFGNFVIACNAEDRLKVMANGFYNQNVKISKKIKLVAINLKLKPSKKNQEYAIGYGNVSDKDKTSAVEILNKDNIDFIQYSDIYELMRGRFAGVEVGNDEIIIRGINSINSSSAALIVLDGVISDYSVLRTISPVDVKNISVIKDGTSAIYGSRGANGVILIETKKGGEI